MLSINRYLPVRMTSTRPHVLGFLLRGVNRDPDRISEEGERVSSGYLLVYWKVNLGWQDPFSEDRCSSQDGLLHRTCPLDSDNDLLLSHFEPSPKIEKQKIPSGMLWGGPIAQSS